MTNNTATRHKLARKLAHRDGGWFCHYCNIPLIPMDDKNNDKYYDIIVTMLYHNEPVYGKAVKRGFGSCEIDHAIPRSRKGSNAINNLVLSCRSCNHEKSDMTESEYFLYLYALENLRRNS